MSIVGKKVRVAIEHIQSGVWLKKGMTGTVMGNDGTEMPLRIHWDNFDPEYVWFQDRAGGWWHNLTSIESLSYLNNKPVVV